MVDMCYFTIVTIVMCVCCFWAGVEFTAWVHWKAKAEKARKALKDSSEK